MAQSILLLFCSLSAAASVGVSVANGLLSEEVTRVAFVFAGSTRSFISPLIHELLRVNLILSFCPPPNCIADVFARVSRSDNTHEHSGRAIKDSHGIEIPTNTSELPLIEHALHRLKSLAPGPGILDIHWADVGSSVESQEMIDRLPSPRHKVFRALDPRRYSMYFNRWSAYMQARTHERTHNVTYSWFIHARFDMAFGAPLAPFTAWTPDRVYVPDQWPTDVPDTFAILPKLHAEAYFSMDALVRPGAMCLGGIPYSLHPLQHT